METSLSGSFNMRSMTSAMPSVLSTIIFFILKKLYHIRFRAPRRCARRVNPQASASAGASFWLISELLLSKYASMNGKRWRAIGAASGPAAPSGRGKAKLCKDLRESETARMYPAAPVRKRKWQIVLRVHYTITPSAFLSRSLLKNSATTGSMIFLNARAALSDIAPSRYAR